MKQLFFFLLFSGTAFSQNIDLNGTKWVGKHGEFLRFGEKTLSVSEAPFLSKYRIDGSTIAFTHDFSYIHEKTIGDKVVPRSEYEVPDSRFRINYLPDSIKLTALNPGAFYTVGILNHPRSHPDEKLFIDWEKTGEQPPELKWRKLDSVITFVNYQTTKNDRHISGIKLTTSCYNMGSKYYTDLVVDSTGFLHARTVSQGYDKGSRANFKYFEGQLDKSELQQLDSLFSFSGMPDNKTVSYTGWASHTINFDLGITHSKGTVYATGTEHSMADLERKFFDAILDLVDEKLIVKQSAFPFEASKFDADLKEK